MSIVLFPAGGYCFISHQFQYSGGVREKARFVLGAMEQRMIALGFGWADVTATRLAKAASSNW